MQDSLEKIKEFLQLAKFKILLGALCLSILVIVGLGGYIVGQNKSIFESFRVFKTTEQPSPTPQPEPSQTPTPTQTPVATSAPTSQGTAKVTPTPKPQPTSSPTLSPTTTAQPTSTPTPNPTPTPTPAGFKLPLIPLIKTAVTEVTVVLTGFTGCTPAGRTYSFGGTIKTNGPGTVTYKWVTPLHEKPGSLVFSKADTLLASFSWDLPSGKFTTWVRLDILTPNSLPSNTFTFNYNCPGN